MDFITASIQWLHKLHLSEQKRNERRIAPPSTSPPELLAHGYSPLLLRFLQALLLALLRLHRLGVPHGLRGLLLQFRLYPQPLRHGILFPFFPSAAGKEIDTMRCEFEISREVMDKELTTTTTTNKCTAVGIEEHSKKTMGGTQLQRHPGRVGCFFKQSRNTWQDCNIPPPR